jgi:Family of unknown function (DUF5946)
VAETTCTGCGATKQATAFLQRAARDKGRFPWLTPPESRGSVTVKDVHRADSVEEHWKLARAWADSAWVSWSLHHATRLASRSRALE